MVITCSVTGCTKRGGRDKGIRFYSIPTVVEHLGEQAKELTKRQREAWIAKINRKDWTPTSNSRVCSDHFLSGELDHLYSKL